MTSRRKFLKAGATIALVAGIPAKLIFGKSPVAALLDSGGGVNTAIGNQPGAVAHLRRSSFTPYVNSVFDVRVKRGPFSRSVPIRLISVTGASERHKKVLFKTPLSSHGDEESFSLLFRGSLRTQLSQDVVDIRHPALGTMNVLLVRVVHRNKNAGHYEVIFNRLHA